MNVRPGTKSMEHRAGSFEVTSLFLPRQTTPAARHAEGIKRSRWKAGKQEQGTSNEPERNQPATFDLCPVLRSTVFFFFFKLFLPLPVVDNLAKWKLLPARSSFLARRTFHVQSNNKRDDGISFGG